MKLKYSKQAVKFLGKLNPKTALRLSLAIDSLPEGDVRKLRGFKDRYRLRVGGFRVEFIRNKDIVEIERINFRGNAYMMGVTL